MHNRKEKGFEIKPYKMIMARTAIYILFHIYIRIYLCAILRDWSCSLCTCM